MSQRPRDGAWDGASAAAERPGVMESCTPLEGQLRRGGAGDMTAVGGTAVPSETAVHGLVQLA